MGIPGLDNGAQGAVQVSDLLDVPLGTPGEGIGCEEWQTEVWPDSGIWGTESNSGQLAMPPKDSAGRGNGCRNGISAVLFRFSRSNESGQRGGGSMEWELWCNQLLRAGKLLLHSLEICLNVTIIGILIKHPLTENLKSLNVASFK